MIREGIAGLLAIAAIMAAGCGMPRYVGIGCSDAPFPIQFAGERWRLETDECARIAPIVSTFE
ncbi:hypothetical protein [Novosphingobium resinovorum]|uniref:Lipoprotein n=1 Tax=Novosphingobium resinovorum TaxID=158500 RepID=A0A1D8A2Z3_9SPHN|nr:hypothetical protein [Novosphingobium resinovorum]AOR76523.1 hypothetical protein BES08_07035 [Novosphingobium resinovorum]